VKFLVNCSWIVRAKGSVWCARDCVQRFEPSFSMKAIIRVNVGEVLEGGAKSLICRLTAGVH
jgi:hypothetical protein